MQPKVKKPPFPPFLQNTASKRGQALIPTFFYVAAEIQQHD